MKSLSTIKRSKGFSLMELLFAIVVIGFLSSVVYAMYGQGTDKSIVNTEMHRVTTLKSVIGDSYGQRNSYAGLNNAQVLTGSQIPASMRTGVVGEIQNSWADAGYAVAPSGGGDTYTITSVQIPDQYCYDIAVAINPVTIEFENMTINGNPVANPGDYSAQCTNGANTIVWTARR